MKEQVITIAGNAYLRSEAIAQIFAVQVTWVHEVVEHGLLEGAAVVEESLCLRVDQMDRIATLVRLQRVYELDWDQLAFYLQEHLEDS